MATFMGHRQDTHKGFYRLSDDAFQKAKLGKLLICLAKKTRLDKKWSNAEEDDDVVGVSPQKKKRISKKDKKWMMKKMIMMYLVVSQKKNRIVKKKKIIRKVKVNGSNGQMKKWRC